MSNPLAKLSASMQAKSSLRQAVIVRLQEGGYLSPEQAAKLTASATSNATPLKSVLVDGNVPEQVFAKTLSELSNITLINTENYPRQAVADTPLLRDFLLEHEALPIEQTATGLRVAMTDVSDNFVIKVLQTKLDCPIEPLVAVRSELLGGLDKLYRSTSTSRKPEPHGFSSSTDIPDDLNSSSVVVRELHRLIQRAIIAGASDIHFEPSTSWLAVRFRTNGLLQQVHRFPKEQAAQVLARIKLMGKLDVSERRIAQNGRFQFPADGRMIDFRVSSLPLHNGESAVLRLLDARMSEAGLAELGFSEPVVNAMQDAIAAQHGLILVTGPTGSGKTTTLYSLLNRLNCAEKKLISIEDPVELNIAGVNQIQVDDEHGVSFAGALSSVLRQDPDVIMVGEIRDTETLRLAAQAALTGHLVISTLHTNSAPAAISRLHNLGLPKYLISATLKAVIAQRLVRCLCTDCAEQDQHSVECKSCAGTGYKGRTTIAEFLRFSEQTTAASDLDSLDAQQNLLNGVRLADDAQRLIDAGITDQAEVIRVLGLPNDSH